jgi:hypothetical protein
MAIGVRFGGPCKRLDYAIRSSLCVRVDDHLVAALAIEHLALDGALRSWVQNDRCP